VTCICATCFAFRAVISAWSAFDVADADLDITGHPLLNFIYYTGAEVIPSALVLYILRRLPPKAVARGGGGAVAEGMGDATPQQSGYQPIASE
jgi:hypothetical protein